MHLRQKLKASTWENGTTTPAAAVKCRQQKLTSRSYKRAPSSPLVRDGHEADIGQHLY